MWVAGLVFAGCSDESHQRCVSDDDCSEGYVCDRGEFEGDCVRRIEVIRCGTAYCNAETESCVNEECVERAGLNLDGHAPDVPRLPDALPRRDAAPMTSDGSVERDLSVRFDAGLPGVPRILIQSPTEDSLYIEENPVLLGRVMNLHPEATGTWRLDESEPASLPLDPDGRFRALLEVPIGRHRITIAVSQGEHHAEAFVEFRFDAFVEERQGELRLANESFTFVGVDRPLLRLEVFTWRAGGSASPNPADAFFDQARGLGASVVRVYAFDDRPMEDSAIQLEPGRYNESGLLALDQVIASAGEKGIKLLLPLVGAGDTLGGVEQYLAWHGFVFPEAAERRRFFVDGEIRDHFKDHVRLLLGRINTLNGIAYRNDPAILGWEVGDGVDAFELFDAASGGAELAAFWGELTGVIREADANHLIATGEPGFDVNTERYGELAEPFLLAGHGWLFDGTGGLSFQRDVILETVDFATIHLAPDAWAFDPQLGLDWIRAHARVAGSLGKTLVVSSARLDPEARPAADRRALVASWLNEVDSLDVSGVLVGDFNVEDYGEAFAARSMPE